MQRLASYKLIKEKSKPSFLKQEVNVYILEEYQGWESAQFRRWSENFWNKYIDSETLAGNDKDADRQCPGWLVLPGALWSGFLFQCQRETPSKGWALFSQFWWGAREDHTAERTLDSEPWNYFCGQDIQHLCGHSLQFRVKGRVKLGGVGNLKRKQV